MSNQSPIDQPVTWGQVATISGAVIAVMAIAAFVVSVAT